MSVLREVRRPGRAFLISREVPGPGGVQKRAPLTARRPGRGRARRRGDEALEGGEAGEKESLTCALFRIATGHGSQWDV